VTAFYVSDHASVEGFYPAPHLEKQIHTRTNASYYLAALVKATTDLSQQGLETAEVDEVVRPLRQAAYMALDSFAESYGVPPQNVVGKAIVATATRFWTDQGINPFEAYPNASPAGLVEAANEGWQRTKYRLDYEALQVMQQLFQERRTSQQV
jgi:hypothetical protein